MSRTQMRIIIGGLGLAVIAVIVWIAAAAGGGSNTDLVDDAAPGDQGSEPSIALSPDHGPDGKEAGVTVSNVPASATVSLKFSDTDLSSPLPVSGGNGSTTHVFTGSVGTRITVTATITHPDTTTETLETVFTITELNRQVPVTVTLEPSEGKSGTPSLITVTGENNSSVTVWFDDQVAPGWDKTNNSGVASRTQEFVGEPGTSITVKAQVGKASDAPTATATFTFTEDAPPEPKVVVSVSPLEGKSGSTATISVTGPADQPITITIGGKKLAKAELTNNGMTDENGNYTQQHQFVGKQGETIPVEAQVGSGGVADPKGSSSFTIKNPTISGGPHTFISTIGVSSDRAGHGPFVGMPEMMDLAVTVNSISIDGTPPFVAVTGDLAEDGTFSVSGRGTVAGFSDVGVRFDGALVGTTLTGDYTMGVDGELPDGEPIVYRIEGELTEDSVATAPDFEAFYDSFNAAQASLDSQTMFDALHPTVLDRYGADVCSGYLAGIVNPDVVLRFVDAGEATGWSYETDGVATEIASAYTVTLDVVVGDAVPTRQETHVAIVDGELRWFTDCGDPLAG